MKNSERQPLSDRERTLIAMGAAMGAGCRMCATGLRSIAEGLGITKGEAGKAFEIGLSAKAEAVKAGARLDRALFDKIFAYHEEWTAAFFAELTPEAEESRRIPTTADLRRFMGNPDAVDTRLRGHVWVVAERNRFFHWPLEFPEVFEQGGFLAQGPRGWELYVPKKIVRLKASSDIDKFSDINFGFYGKNRTREEGLLLKVSQRIPSHIDPIFKQVTQKRNGTALLQTAFFTADQIILYNGESFGKFILRLDHNGGLAHLDEGSLKAMLEEAKYVEPEIDNTTGEITDEYKYVPLVLEIEALGSPREILHGKNWRGTNLSLIHISEPTRPD